jgi:hypothetical protein
LGGDCQGAVISHAEMESVSDVSVTLNMHNVRTLTKSTFINDSLIYKICVGVIFKVEVADVIEHTHAYYEGCFC